MTGMSKITGRPLSRQEHIQQSITDILTTPIGSRVMRRDYGSLLFELIDQPGNPATTLLLMAATVGAIMAWEPRIRVTHIQISLGKQLDGTATIDLEGEMTDSNEPLSLRVPLTPGAAS